MGIKDLRRGFVGREREFQQLLRGFEEVRSGTGRLYILVGEPGIGKTRLAEAVCGHLRSENAVVVSGRCWDGAGAPAFWPWIQAIRDLLDSLARPPRRAVRVEPRAAYVAHLVPEVRDVFAKLPEPPPLQGELARVPLFDGVAHLFKAVSRQVPLAVFIDDLHAADKASLLLMKYVARELADGRVLGIGTYRPVEARLNPDVAQTLSVLTEADRIFLGGLQQRESRQLIEQTLHDQPSESLVAAVHDATEGNPFFIEEITRMLSADPSFEVGRNDFSDLPIPEEVRAIIRRRLEPLDDDVRRALIVASVVGRQFSAPLIQKLVSTDPQAVGEILQRAVDAALLVETRDAAGAYDFTHSLIRDTLYNDLLTPERITLHRQVGQTLEAIHSKNPEPHVSELAHHFLEAAPSGTLQKAIDYGTRAGEQAEAVHAYEEAAGHYGRTLRALDLDEPADEVLRCGLLLALGNAQRKAGDTSRAKATFKVAGNLAHKLDAPRYLGKAALGYAGTGFLVRSGAAEPDVIEFLEETLQELPPEDSTLVVMLRARLAMELYWSTRAEERVHLAKEAVAMARRLGDERATAFALAASRFALWTPDKLDESIAAATEIIELGNKLDDRELVLQGYGWRLRDLLEIGDIHKIDEDIYTVSRLAEELRQPMYVWYSKLYRGLQAQWAGRFDEAENLTDEAHRIGARVHEDLDAQITLGNLIAIRRDQGRLYELKPYLERVIQQYPQVFLWRTILAGAYADEGDEGQARFEFERLKAHGFGFPKDLFFTSHFIFLSELTALFSDRDAAVLLYDMLSPYARRNVVPGRLGSFSVGSTSHYLGILASASERHDQAEIHFKEALELHARMGAKVYVARTQLEYADMLSSRGLQGDKELAIDLLERATSIAQEVQVPPVLKRSKPLLESLTSRGSPARSVHLQAVLTREGEFWTIGMDGEASRLRNSKGLRYVAELVAAPDREFHALQLALHPKAGSTRVGRADEGSISLEESDTVLDRRAIAEYRRRLEDLNSVLDEATAYGDEERAARARDEIDFLSQELSSAVGLGGRSRKTVSNQERARWTVTKNIKSAIKKISAECPRLGGHLAASIKTGTYCSYSPDPNTGIRWKVSS